MIRNVFLVLFMSIAHSLFSQELGTYSRIELGINGIGFALETPVANKIVLETTIGLGPSYNINEEGNGITGRLDYKWAFFYPSLHLSAYGKFFYNRNKRLEKGKSLQLNSGNFIGVKVKYVSKSRSNFYIFDSNTMLANLNWGRQRNIGKHWLYSYSFGLGYGYNMDESYGILYPAIDLKIAYILPFFSKKQEGVRRVY